MHILSVSSSFVVFMTNALGNALGWSDMDFTPCRLSSYWDNSTNNGWLSLTMLISSDDDSKIYISVFDGHKVPVPCDAFLWWYDRIQLT